MTRHAVLGAGPVGRAIVNSLAQRHIDAVVITRSGTEVPGATTQKVDVRDTDALATALAGADVVYQASQPEYHRWPQEFPALQASVVNAAKRSGSTFVAVDNLYGYAPSTKPLTEDLPQAATTRKGRTRADMWRALEAEWKAGNLKVTSGRASDFFGPFALGSQVGERFFGTLVAGKKAETFGDPNALHSYTYVVDFGEALVRLALDERSLGRAWHVPNASAITNGEFLARVAAIAGVPANSVRRTAFQLRLAGLFIPPAREIIEMLYEFEHDFVVDHSAYAATFGDHGTPLDESLAVTIDWFRQHAKG
ncbi:MAG: NAD-dependent epimerase/dehydratase family protein [Actinobacteria bacterium]|nr:NAD-dependent epimerase/dehydratase family protein [Actinomycetota bacterium]